MQFWKCKTFEKHVDNEYISWKLSHICCLFRSSPSLSTFVVFKSVGWRFRLWDGSSRQLLPTNNKRGSTQTGITENIYTSTWPVWSYKAYKQTNKETKHDKCNNTAKDWFQHLFIIESTQPHPHAQHSLSLSWQVIFWDVQKRWTLKAAELTIMDRVSFQISSIQAAPQYAEYQMVRTKLVQIFPFNWPLGPHWPPSTQRRHSAVFIFRINLWLCQIDAHKIFCNATIHWNTNDFQWKIILLQRIQMYQ